MNNLLLLTFNLSILAREAKWGRRIICVSLVHIWQVHLLVHANGGGLAVICHLINDRSWGVGTNLVLLAPRSYSSYQQRKGRSLTDSWQLFILSGCNWTEFLKVNILGLVIVSTLVWSSACLRDVLFRMFFSTFLVFLQVVRRGVISNTT